MRLLHDLLTYLSDNPFLQGVVAALATFVLEDPATVGSGLLVAEGHMAFATALIGLSMGIAIGDIGLYGAGRLLGHRLIGRGPLTPGRMHRAQSWFHRNVTTAVVLSRFVPGMRLPTYVAAGFSKAPVGRFVVSAVSASLVWTTILLTASVQLGSSVLPLLGHYRWPVAMAALAAMVVSQGLAVRRMDASQAGSATPEPVVSSFEFWSPWLFYLPMLGWWLWLALRYRGLMLPTAANPRIYAGGFLGESKSAILGQVPLPHRRWIAPWTVVHRDSDDLDGEQATVRAEAALDAAGLALPVVAKPDVGQRGAGVRPIHNRLDLQHYLAAFPAEKAVVLQRLVGGVATESGHRGPQSAREAGVLWFRLPGELRGTVFSLTLKVFPSVEGDGQRTLGELIEADPRANLLGDVYRRRHRQELERILEPGVVFPLVFAGNHCQGTIFLDGTPLVTDDLAQRIEEIAGAIPEFWFGRFDIMFDDLDAFLAGKDLNIVEINGASAEATHIWDASLRLGDAYRVLRRQFEVLFEIGAANRKRGFETLPIRRFAADLIDYRRTARHYPSTM